MNTAQAFAASLFSCRFGLHSGCGFWARFRRGVLVDGSPAVVREFALMNAHFIQTGF